MGSRATVPFAPPDSVTVDRTWRTVAGELRIVRRHWWSRGRLQQKWKVSKQHLSGYPIGLGCTYEWRDVDCVKVDRDGRDISGTTEW